MPSRQRSASRYPENPRATTRLMARPGDPAKNAILGVRSRVWHLLYDLSDRRIYTNLVSSELTEFYIEISDSAETRARAHEDPHLPGLSAYISKISLRYSASVRLENMMVPPIMISLRLMGAPFLQRQPSSSSDDWLWLCLQEMATCTSRIGR